MRIYPSVRERLMTHSIPEPNTGCWLWTGALEGDGYGLMKVNRRMVRAARASYETFVGPIPEGLTIDHLCRQRCCINPEHLEPVTNRENILRSDGVTANNARKTHCPHGHPLSGENLYLHKGHRMCRACLRASRERLAATGYFRDWKRRRREARRAAKLPQGALPQAPVTGRVQ